MIKNEHEFTHVKVETTNRNHRGSSGRG